MAATPYEILTFIGRGTGARDYDRLKARARPAAVDDRADLDPPGLPSGDGIASPGSTNGRSAPAMTAGRAGSS